MKAIRTFAENGGYVFGICNGFQILCESGLLPGVLLRNIGQNFICRHVNLRVENNNTPYTSEIEPNSTLSIPIAHADGNYYCDDDTYRQLEENGQIVFRYCNEAGEAT
ncbi:phosphoribosylformylglycinamidine synthase subunit PurQ, partial [Vibrio parahaemolyticus]|uniref:phosphoribosylformylglycinamidine synthase subunit PurQ n=1 Tax=Vibrio parahaemolyticus TaxID=670 RepID=UPI0020162A61